MVILTSSTLVHTLACLEVLLTSKHPFLDLRGNTRPVSLNGSFKRKTIGDTWKIESLQ